jgi:hypothetical protein
MKGYETEECINSLIIIIIIIIKEYINLGLTV